jgi:hypothetical protein
MAGISIGSAVLGGIGSNRAARQREQAIGTAQQAADEGYRRADELMVPRADQEQDAMALVNELLGLTDGGSPDYSRFRDSPGYQFQQDEQARMVERSAAARGNLLSGNTAAELQERSQGLADSTFQNYLMTLLGLSTQGVDRTRAGIAIDRGTTFGDYAVGRGEARASGIEGTTNALLGGFQSGAGLYGQVQAQNNLRLPPAPKPVAPRSSAYGK